MVAGGSAAFTGAFAAGLINADAGTIQSRSGYVYAGSGDRVVVECGNNNARGGDGGGVSATSIDASTGAVTAGPLSMGAGGIQTAGTLAAGTCMLGAVTAASLNAGMGTIATAGALQGGVTMLGATTATSINASGVACGSVNAGAGTITTTGGVSTGTLNASGATTLAMTTIASLAVLQAFSVGTELVYRGAAMSRMGTTAVTCRSQSNLRAFRTSRFLCLLRPWSRSRQIPH
jgi:hypothetical protein